MTCRSVYDFKIKISEECQDLFIDGWSDVILSDVLGPCGPDYLPAFDLHLKDTQYAITIGFNGVVSWFEKSSQNTSVTPFSFEEICDRIPDNIRNRLLYHLNLFT